jgi:hypothetical protein
MTYTNRQKEVPHTIKILPNSLLQPLEVLKPDKGNIKKQAADNLIREHI